MKKYTGMYAQHKNADNKAAWDIIIDEDTTDIALTQDIYYVTNNGNTVSIRIKTWHDRNNYTIKLHSEIMQEY